MSHRNGVFNNLKQQCIFTNDRRTRFKSSFKTLGEHLKNQNKLFFLLSIPESASDNGKLTNNYFHYFLCVNEREGKPKVWLETKLCKFDLVTLIHRFNELN